MNATAFGIYAALTGQPRVAQSVHLVKATIGPSGHRCIALVIPEGRETGDYYSVSKRGFDKLVAGTSPEDLGLAILDPSEVDGEQTPWRL